MSDIHELTQLVLRERQGRDRGWWRQMRESFHNDSTVRLSWFQGSGPDFVTESKKMSGNGNRALHRLAPPVLKINNHKAIIEVPSAIEFRIFVNDVETDIVSFARLLYRAERRDGVWKLLSLDAIYERDTMTPVVPGAILELVPDQLAGLRPTYRFIGYHLRNLGYEIRNDLYGDDHPAEVQDLYRSAFEWAEIVFESE
jgi:hypothetical protein